MLKGSRQEDQYFSPEEYLFRRVPLELWDDPADDIDVDAIELPDMSVMREKYAEPRWVRLEREEYANWGVIGFRVGAIPANLMHLGVFAWLFRPAHRPYRKNYPHSQVEAFEEGIHVAATDRLDPDLHLRWRERLLRGVEKFVSPHET